MSDLANMMRSILDTHAKDHPRELARSEHWLSIRERYLQLSLNLIVNGHHSLTDRVDREYQAMRDALRSAVESAREGTTVQGDYPFWEAATEFLFTVGHLEHWHARIIDESRVEAAKELPTPKASADPPKRAWTRHDLDNAIREYKAKRSASFEQYFSVLEDPKAPASRKRTVRKEARAMFGRNVIAKALGVKSARMVSESPAWVAIAKTLDLPRRADQGTAPPKPKTRIGHEIAVEQASADAADTDEYAAADASARRAEQEETLRQIRKLAESELPEAKSNAKALFDRYQEGTMTDEQVREAVEVLTASPDADLG